MCGGGEEGEELRERERISSGLCTEHGASCGAWSRDPEIMTWAETESQMLTQVPQLSCILKKVTFT